MLFSPVFAKLQSRLGLLVPLPYSKSKFAPWLQPFCPQILTDSPAPRQHRNSFGINAFRTPFTTTEGVPLFNVASAKIPVVHPLFLQSLTICSSRNPFILITIHFHGGCIPLLLPSMCRSKFQRISGAEIPPRSGRSGAHSASRTHLRDLQTICRPSYLSRGRASNVLLEPARLRAKIFSGHGSVVSICAGGCNG